MGDTPFTLVVGAVFSDGSVARECKCSIIATRELLVVRVSGVVTGDGKPEVIDLSRTTHARIIGNCIAFEMNRVLVYSLLFSNRNSFLSFVAALVDAGVLIPLRNDSLLVMEKHSFVPRPRASFKRRGVPAILKQLVTEVNAAITETNAPMNASYVDEVVDIFHHYFVVDARRWLARHPDQAVSKWPVKLSTILGVMKKRVQVEKGLFKQLLAEYEGKANSDFDAAKRKILNTIDYDAERTWTDDPAWCDEMKDKGRSICRAALARGHRFAQGEFDIVQKLILLFHGSSGIPGDSSSLPEWVEQMSENEKDDMMFAVYMKLVATNEKFYENLVAAITDITDTTFKVLDVAAVGLRKWYLVHNMNMLMWSGNDLPLLYQRSFKDCWRLWLWLLHGGEDSYHMLVAFAVALNILAMPTFVANGCKHMDDLLVRGGWDAILKDMDICGVLDVASYVYKCYMKRKGLGPDHSKVSASQ